MTDGIVEAREEKLTIYFLRRDVTINLGSRFVIGNYRVLLTGNVDLSFALTRRNTPADDLISPPIFY